MSFAVPFRLGLSDGRDVPAYPASRSVPAEPTCVPWPLKTLGSAECGAAQGSAAWRRALSPLIRRFVFDEAHGIAWLRHNIEEVGMLEHFLPGLYRRETGRDD